jgi:hypothetical protein
MGVPVPDATGAAGAAGAATGVGAATLCGVYADSFSNTALPSSTSTSYFFPFNITSYFILLYLFNRNKS